MKITADHAFHIGEQHLRQGKPNQDYALSGVLAGGLHYGIVADGCSSGRHTDIGARLMALALKQALAEGPLYSLVDRTRVYLEGMRRALDLETRDLLATGLLAIATESQLVDMRLLGDGIMVEKSIHGTLYVNKYEWSDNAPLYLAYTDSDQANFLARKPTLTHEFWSIRGPDDWCHHRALEKSATAVAREGVIWKHEPSRGLCDLAGIGIFSDGVLHVDEMPWQRVVWELMNFKSTGGQFVTRRMNRFLTEAKKHGRGPLDDIAMAAIHFEHNVL